MPRELVKLRTFTLSFVYYGVYTETESLFGLCDLQCAHTSMQIYVNEKYKAGRPAVSGRIKRSFGFGYGRLLAACSSMQQCDQTDN